MIPKKLSLLLCTTLLVSSSLYAAPPDKPSFKTASNKPQDIKTVALGTDYVVPDQVIVRFKAGINQISLQSSLASIGLQVAETHSFPQPKTNQLGLTVTAPTEIAVLKIQDGSPVKTAIEKLQKSGLVVYAEPNYTRQLLATTPNDPSFSSLWAMNNLRQSGGTLDADIDAVEAWDIHRGNNTVVVGVVDTGIDYNHTDLNANMWRNPRETAANGRDDDGNGYIDDVYGVDCINVDGDPMDGHSHGTHVAGTIGARGNNSLGVAGVNWTTSMMALKIFTDGGSTTDAAILRCLSYAAAMKARGDVNLKVTNNSWGGGSYSQAEYDAFNSLGNLGILSAMAAGNATNNNDANPHYPSSYNLASIIAVASTDHNDAMSSFSSYGATSVDLGAPGSAIYSTVPGNSYASYSGTSMATPHVAGAAAYLWSRTPSYTVAQVKARLMDLGDAKPSLAGRTVSGKRLNLYNSVGCTPGNPALNIVNPISSFRLPTNVNTLVSASITDCGTPVTGRSVTASISTGGSLTLLDNGTGGDERASDGIYTATWRPTVASTAVTVQVVSGTLNSSVTGAVITVPTYTMMPTTYSWIDATRGTRLSISSSDDNYLSVPLGFNFSFYGETYNSIWVSTNGLVSFGTVGTSSYSNVAIPNTSTPNNFIAAMWDDLYPRTASPAGIYSYVTGTAPNRVMTISWNDIQRYSSSPSGATFQVNLYEGTNNIVLQYRDVDFGTATYNGGRDATVGIENGTGEFGTQYSYNTASLNASQAILFTPNAINALPLLLNSQDATNRGYNWSGAVQYPAGSILYSFTNNGLARTLYLRGYDVDNATELCAHLNNSSVALACVPASSNNALTPEYAITIPLSAQVTGINYVQIRARLASSSDPWGVTQVGLYDYPKNTIPLTFGGAVNSNRYGYGWSGANNSYPNGVTFVTHLATVPSTGTFSFIGLDGFDIDTSTEACLYFNGTNIGCIPAGPNNGMTGLWYFNLPSRYMRVGYNTLEVRHPSGTTNPWGVTSARLVQATMPAGLAGMGLMAPIKGSLPTAK